MQRRAARAAALPRFGALNGESAPAPGATPLPILRVIAHHAVGASTMRSMVAESTGVEVEPRLPPLPPVQE